jgi:cell division protein FtsI (penicillin-binding protein 3)
VSVRRRSRGHRSKRKRRPNDRPALRRRLILAGWVALSAIIVARAVQVQVVQRDHWAELAETQHQRTSEVPAPRGAILDRHGSELAISLERMRVAVAPHELEDSEAAAGLLAEALGVPVGEARRVTTSSQKWKYFPGDFPPSVREALRTVEGVYTERVMQRFHPNGLLGTQLLGVVSEGRGSGGIEQAFDSILRGTPGKEVSARDGHGQPIPGQTLLMERPAPGGQILLTIDRDVQEIALEALQSQIERTGAEGGDLLVVDPTTGEILAMVSIQRGDRPALSAINAPYEPGSTIKPFTVAGLLDRNLASLEDSIDTGEGYWTVKGRTVRDVHPNGKFTLADALRLSSNVGVAMAAQAMSPEEQYETLRDFGFGAYTGIPLPGEVQGVLRHPTGWSAQSAVSLAIGYEIAVTPVQMAMAYAALANGGDLMEPTLVKEVRSPTGKILERRKPRVVRKVVSGRVTGRVNRILEEVVEDGTGTRAQMATFRVAGKSGTTRAYGPGGYQRGDYFSSFVGFFPADDPQLVIYVKLDRPEGAYYGGAVAAPVTLATLEAILAARRAPLDRRALAKAVRREARAAASSPFQFAATTPRRVRAGVSVWSELPAPAPPATPGPVRGLVRVPLLEGLPLRSAVRKLHAYGLRVEWNQYGDIAGTDPPLGAWVSPGDTVRIVTRRADG